MELKSIYERIDKNIKNSTFLLSDTTTTATNDISTLLKEAFQLTSLTMENVVSSFTDKIQLKGNTVIDSQSLVTFVVIFENDKDQSILCSFTAIMPRTWNMPLDEEGMFSLLNVEKSFQKHTGKADISGNASGCLQLPGIQFQATGRYDYETHKWLYSFTGAAYTLRSLIQGLDHYAHLGIPAEILPDTALKNLAFTYEERGKDLWDNLTLEVTTGYKFSITENLAIESFGIAMHKRNMSYSYAIKGELVIGTTRVPLYMQAMEDQFNFGVDVGDEGCPLPSLSDVASIFGMSRHMSVFPKEIANGKNLILRLLTIGTSCNLKQIRQFFVTVSVDTDWDFFGLRNLCLKEIELGFYRQTISEKAVNGFTIIGTICISDISVQLGGNYTFEKGWTFTGILLPHEEIHLDEIWISFTDMLDFSGVSSLPIPKISLYDIQIEFNVPDKAFSAKAKSRITSKDSASILEKLFEINAEIRMQSTLKEQKRTCSGQFSGELYIGDSKFTVAYDFDTVSPGNTVAVKWKPVSEKETLSLVKIVKHFGVQDIPQVVSDLDFAISGVEMRYDLDAKELAIQVTSDKFDKIRLTVSDEDYEIDIQLKNALSLSRLPLVGTYLHVLDKVAIENLELFASSKDNQAKETLSGAAFLGSLCEKAFVLQIYHNKAKQEQMLQEPSGASLTKWFAMDKSFGIFELYRLGIGYIDGSITFLLDASLTSKPIGLSLLGIGLGINLSSPGDVSFHLSGIKISYDSGTLAISGSFLKSTLHDAESYDGTLLVKTGDFALFAVGTYSKNAFIVSALINKNFGGPPVFFVTGIAASFAYNMDVNIPVIDSISKFPLVSAAMGNLKKEEMLEKLKDYLRIENGQTFLAAGITFTSFEMIESFALLTFTFGNHTQVNLLGLSQMSIPPHMKRDNDPLAYAQLVLKASFDPKAGLFSVMAKLTSESYILSKKCKLTGGFAFYTWFLREHAGDFVVTLGGYHPLYKRPAHYPDVPRVGFTWDVTSHVNLSGDMYFALTPSVLMAGGRFCALYKKGCVRAWFTVEADFYIAWKPFFYEAKIFACFGVAVKVHILFVHKTIKVELSAGLQIWGPEFSGKAHISLYIISFTIGFGAGASKEPPPLAWTEFRHSFLPQKKSGRVAEQQPEVAFSEDDRALPLSLSLSNGQRGEEQSGSEMVPIVSSTGMELLIKSAVPVTAIELDDTAVPLNKEMPEAGVLPMGEGKRLLSTLSVTCKHAAGQSREWVVEPVYDNLPNAVWGMTKKGDALLKNVAVGLRLYPKEHQTSIFPKTGFIDLNRLSVYSCIERTFTFNPTWQLPPYSQEDAIEEFSGTVMKDEIKHKRHGWIEGLNAAGFDFDFTVDLSKMAEEADNIFSEEMILGVLL